MNCSDCRFWSEMLARSVGESIQAMCICDDSPKFMKYTLCRHGCKVGLSGFWGAVDAPGNEGAYDAYPTQKSERKK